MSHVPDPGGNFDSDAHRRVLAYVWNDEARDFEALVVAMTPDPYHGLEDPEEVQEVLKDLEAEGYVSESKAGWKRTKKGFEAITAEPVAPGGPQAATLDGLEAT